MKKELCIINATTETGKEIRKAKSKNTFVFGKVATIKDGQITIGILLSSDMNPKEAREFIENFAQHTKGKYFLAYIPFNIFSEFEVYQNLNLSLDESKKYLDTTFKLVGVEELVMEEQMKCKLAA